MLILTEEINSLAYEGSHTKILTWHWSKLMCWYCAGGWERSPCPCILFILLKLCKSQWGVNKISLHYYKTLLMFFSTEVNVSWSEQVDGQWASRIWQYITKQGKKVKKKGDFDSCKLYLFPIISNHKLQLLNCQSNLGHYGHVCQPWV